jgi:hypothetical protein
MSGTLTHLLTLPASAVSVRLLRMREQLERHIREHGCAAESPMNSKTESTDSDARKKIRPAVMRVHPSDEGTSALRDNAVFSQKPEVFVLPKPGQAQCAFAGLHSLRRAV